MNRKLNILMIGTTEEQGGAAKPGWEVGKYMRNKGHTVNYTVGYKTTEKKYVHELRHPVMRWIDKKTGYNITSLIKHGRAYIFANDIDFGDSEKIINHKWYKDADIIHCHNLHGNFFKLETLKKMSKEKTLVWTLQDMWPITAHSAYYYEDEKFNNGKNFIIDTKRYEPMLWDNTEYLWRKKKEIYNKSRLNLVSPSKWLANLVNKSILKGHPVTIIPNHVDTRVFYPKNKDKLRKKLGIPKDKKIILYLAQGGLKDPRKGWKYAQQIIPRFDNEKVFFLSIGDKPPKENLNKNIKFVPFIPSREQISDYFSASDIFLFPSLADNCPLSVLEAIASGLLVVGFKTGGTPEIIKHKIDGYMAKYKDINDLTKGLYWALSLDDKEYRRISNNNVKKAHKYDSDKIGKEYEKLYHKLIK